MSPDPNKKSERAFQCRDILWETFEQMARELECSVDYLINEAMKQYARQRSRIGRTDSVPAAAGMGTSSLASAGARVPQPAASGNVQATPPSLAHGGRPALPAPTPPPPLAAGGYVPPPPLPPPPVIAPRLGPSLGPSLGATLSGGRPLPPPPPPSLGARSNMLGAPPPLPAPLPLAPPPQQPPPPQQHSAQQHSAQQHSAQQHTSQQHSAQGQPQQPMMMMPAGVRMLVAVYMGEQVAITKDRFIIGRGRQSSDLTIKDPNVSRQHAMVEFHNGQYYMVDLGSTNGVEYNGQRVAKQLIVDGDTFRICDHEVRFVFA
jgi:hypothetical protein